MKKLSPNDGCRCNYGCRVTFAQVEHTKRRRQISIEVVDQGILGLVHYLPKYDGWVRLCHRHGNNNRAIKRNIPCHSKARGYHHRHRRARFRAKTGISQSPCFEQSSVVVYSLTLRIPLQHIFCGHGFTLGRNQGGWVQSHHHLLPPSHEGILVKPINI